MENELKEFIRNSGIKINHIEKMAGIPRTMLNHYLASRYDLSADQKKSLIEVLEKYGFKKSETQPANA